MAHTGKARATAFLAWVDSAIVYFKKELANNTVLPKSIVVKMILQMQNMTTAKPTKSLLYGPVTLMPAAFTVADKQRQTEAYINLVKNNIVPAYKKLRRFFAELIPSKSKNNYRYKCIANGGEK